MHLVKRVLTKFLVVCGVSEELQAWCESLDFMSQLPVQSASDIFIVI
jgi:hypothetical protein